MAGLQSAAQGDIQSPQAPKGQEYGEATAQLASQRKVPLPGNPHAASQVNPRLQGMQPGQGPSLSDDTMYPNEPVTAGLPIGPGAGPEALLMAPPGDAELGELRAIYNERPSDGLRRLIEFIETHGP